MCEGAPESDGVHACVSAEEWSLFTTATVDLEAKGPRFHHSCILRFTGEHRFEAFVV